MILLIPIIAIIIDILSCLIACDLLRKNQYYEYTNFFKSNSGLLHHIFFFIVDDSATIFFKVFNFGSLACGGF